MRSGQGLCSDGETCTETDCYRNDIALPFTKKTLADYFSEAGYDVGYVGKWHLTSNGSEDDYKIKPIPLERRGGGIRITGWPPTCLSLSTTGMTDIQRILPGWMFLSDY